MARAPKVSRTVYRCQSCGHAETRWLGRCPECQEWSSLVEEVGGRGVGLVVAGSERGATGDVAMSIADVPEEPAGGARLKTDIDELDRVLGGGLVAGSMVLLGGEPGIGKSTLLRELRRGAAARVARAPGGDDRPVLYVSGEESVAQTAMRARRVGATAKNLIVLAETNLERIVAEATRLRPAVLAIDSVQTIHTQALDSIPGAIGQVRECAARLMQYAKGAGVPTILVGHVTKDGAIAGPKTLEHLVDVVLQFEGEGGSAYRILRAHKNRFGSTQEIGVFEMRGAGLVEVANPSELFLAERPRGAPGSVVVASADGSRPILVEVQALVAPASAGLGRRTAAGIDPNRVALLLAVLAQRAHCDVITSDVFLNVAGGLRLTEPAIDLAIACAVASSARGRAVDAGTVVFGEIGLAGEVRAVPLADVRISEAAKLGFTRCLLPAANASRIEDRCGLELVPVDRLTTALAAL